jgi:hypothetical protein
MITQGEDVEINALRKRGWSYAAIGRHIGRDWRTVKDYLEDKRQPGVRRRPGPDALERFVPYLSARFVDDPHVWASTLFDEVTELGYACAYPSFARQVRLGALRPHCEACSGVTRPGHHRDRAPRGRRGPMGLVRAAQGPLGRWDRLRAARHAAPLGA